MTYDWSEWLVVGGLALIAILLVGLIADCAGGTTEYHDELVIEKAYVPSSTAVGTTIIDGKVGTTTTHNPEQWILLTEGIDGVESCNVSRQEWATTERGEMLNVTYRRGGMSGTLYRLC